MGGREEGEGGGGENVGGGKKGRRMKRREVTVICDFLLLGTRNTGTIDAHYSSLSGASACLCAQECCSCHLHYL